MKKLLYLIMAVLLVQIADAIILENVSWYNPTQSNFYYVVNRTVQGINMTQVNATCVTINSTAYCGEVALGWLYSVEIIVLGEFNFNIVDVGIEWIRLSWNSTPNVTAQYSFDGVSWTNLSVVTTTAGIEYALPSDTMIYLRAKNTTTEYKTDSQRTKDIIQADDYYLYIVIFICFVTLLGLYYYLDDPVFGMLAGILAVITAVGINNIGFLNLTNTFLKQGIVDVLWGIGAYYIIVPSLKMINDWGGG